jgi:hypothetical protein
VASFSEDSAHQKWHFADKSKPFSEKTDGAETLIHGYIGIKNLLPQETIELPSSAEWIFESVDGVNPIIASDSDSIFLLASTCLVLLGVYRYKYNFDSAPV